ncbi:helix-turn-helix transcriptional regulator [Shouchella clausii]|uniref:helix-turn-helix transcriptional regulator n=1 Tax=Shouchella clausii TaxID=79880 RepID=UPI001C72DC3F|nr:helix-turn-helix transcriptional regulator [Shouchella clausii]MBX0319790.1 helix-turn-helix transcriptional regulator [Shouchella clausii]
MQINNVQDLLIKSRKKKSYSQQKVAELTGLGITRQYYGMIEKCERRPSVETAKAIASVLEINWTIFFEDERNLKFHRKKDKRKNVS